MDPVFPSMDTCSCCDRSVSRIHRMSWDNDLSWLCDDCMEQAIVEADEEAAERHGEGG